MKVSIVICCYNREAYLSRAIRSALSQNFPENDFEVVVVDDGSTDHSPEIAADFGEQIVYLPNRENRGLPASRNAGVRKAMGRFVVNLDSDDYLHEDLLYVESLHLRLNPHWGAVSCDYLYVDEHENHISRVSGVAKPIACGIMFRKDALIAAGLYDERMRMCEEEELRARFIEKFHIGHVELPLYRYRLHEENMSWNSEEMQHYRAEWVEKKKNSIA
jgi:glycosyltransferase involved in cell wall biosynthesis